MVLHQTLFGVLLAVFSVCSLAQLSPVGADIEGSPAQGIPPWSGGLKEAPSGFEKSAGFKDPFEADQSKKAARLQGICNPVFRFQRLKTGLKPSGML